MVVTIVSALGRIIFKDLRSEWWVCAALETPSGWRTFCWVRRVQVWSVQTMACAAWKTSCEGLVKCPGVCLASWQLCLGQGPAGVDFTEAGTGCSHCPPQASQHVPCWNVCCCLSSLWLSVAGSPVLSPSYRTPP